MVTKWVLITPEDTCAWNLKSPEWGDTDPALDVMQKAVGGLITYIPNSWLMDGITKMVANEEGKLIGLPVNQLATQLLDKGTPIVGNVLVQWDEKMDHKEFWVGGDQ